MRRLSVPQVPTFPMQTTDSGRRTELSGYASMVLVAVFFASSLLLARAFADLIPPFGMTALRWIGVGLILAVTHYRSLVRYRGMLRENRLRLLVLGAAGMTIPAVTTYLAAHTTAPANIGLISSAAPVMVILGGALFFGQRLSLRRAIGVIISIFGVTLIVMRGSVDVLLSLTFVPGDLWALTGAVAWASYTLLLTPWRLSLPAMVQLCALSFFGLASSIPFALWEAIDGPYYTELDWRFAAIAVYTILIPSLLAFALHAHTARVLSPAHAAMSQYLVPVFAAAMGALLLDDHFLAYHMVGGAAVLTGVWLASRIERPQPV
jgi:drug/metabolite transporter (DMT)-like permease